jgi:hypothetical protein
MDDLARDVCERQAQAEAQADAQAARNEYLVDELEPVHRFAGKQEDAMTIEVRVRWQKVGGREYWHRPYVTTVTFAELRRKPDALWKLLTRCLPLEEWKYLDWGVGEFHARLYSQNADDEPLTEEEEGHREFWFDGFMWDRIRPSELVCAEFPDKEANVKEALRELVLSDENGPLYLYEHYQPKRERQVGRCWFVLSAIADNS